MFIGRVQRSFVRLFYFVVDVFDSKKLTIRSPHTSKESELLGAHTRAQRATDMTPTHVEMPAKVKSRQQIYLVESL